MKTITIKYFDEDEQTICDYQYKYPTEKELLEIFPEAKEIIPQKIQDWTRIKGKLLAKETIPYFKKCNELKDDLKKAFWKEAYKYCAGRFNEVIRQLDRLKRLDAMLKTPGRFENWEAKKILAKERPIVELYDFEKLKKTKNGYVCLCPIHQEKTPSFHIRTENNSWVCYGCSRKGDSIDFIKMLTGMNFSEAVDYLVGTIK